jgi:membrane protease YdiL (CAAX protease family)
MEFASKPEPKVPARPRASVRVAVFVSLAWILFLAMGFVLLPWAGTLITGALTSFGAAALANAISVRIYERGRLEDIGLSSPNSGRNSAIGFAAGALSALIVAGIPLLLGLARLEPAPDQPANWRSLVFVSFVLLMGAMGEEMLFRGYAFQVLLRRWGPFATILPTAVLFASAHSGNPDAGWLPLLNTFLWGVLFGLCFLRSGDLWLPIGLHFGWNWTLPLFGVNLSGFTMSVTGYRMSWSAGPLWSGGGYGLEGSLLTLLILPLTAWALWKAPVGVTRPYLLESESGEVS